MDPVRATRYVTPLFEGGSLPGIMEADDLGTYVVKFRGAGQGPRALVAEVVCAEIAGAIGLQVPRWVPVQVPAQLAPAEPHEEVQHLLRASTGVNLGIDFLAGALDVGPAPDVAADLAGRIVWFDALVGNVDRSWRNPNMLLWHRELYLIDHGAALTFHHMWAPSQDGPVQRFAERPYEVADHALLERAPDVGAADEAMARVDWPGVVRSAVAAVPDDFLVADVPVWGSPDAVRAGYEKHLLGRVAARDVWVGDLVGALERDPDRDAGGSRVSARRPAGGGRSAHGSRLPRRWP